MNFTRKQKPIESKNDKADYQKINIIVNIVEKVI